MKFVVAFWSGRCNFFFGNVLRWPKSIKYWLRLLYCSCISRLRFDIRKFRISLNAFPHLNQKLLLLLLNVKGPQTSCLFFVYCVSNSFPSWARRQIFANFLSHRTKKLPHLRPLKQILCKRTHITYQRFHWRRLTPQVKKKFKKYKTFFVFFCPRK